MCCNNVYSKRVVDNSLLLNAEEIVTPSSITECVMKCQRKIKEGFFTDDKKCFCHNGVIEDQGEIKGISTEELKLTNEGKCK